MDAAILESNISRVDFGSLHVSVVNDKEGSEIRGATIVEEGKMFVDGQMLGP